MSFPRLGARRKTVASSKSKVYVADIAHNVDCPVQRRKQLWAGAHFHSPALIQKHATTNELFEEGRCTVTETSELIISVESA